MPQKIFDRFRLARERSGLSRIDLAKILDLTSPVQISRYETGKAFPPVETLNKLVEVLRVDLHWLITGKSSPMALHLMPFCLRSFSKLSEEIEELKTYLSELLIRKSRGEKVDDEIIETRANLEGLESYAEVTRKMINDVLGPIGESL